MGDIKVVQPIFHWFHNHLINSGQFHKCCQVNEAIIESLFPHSLLWLKMFKLLSLCSVFLMSSEVHTILDAALKVVDDSSQDGRQVHYVSALSEAQSEQLIPTGSHQTRVCLLAETEKKK